MMHAVHIDTPALPTAAQLCATRTPDHRGYDERDASGMRRVGANFCQKLPRAEPQTFESGAVAGGGQLGVAENAWASDWEAWWLWLAAVVM